MTETKITDFVHRGYSRLLLVEGPDDADFVYGLLGVLKLRHVIYLHQIGGKDNFEKALIALIMSAEFEDLQQLGIIRDADYNTDAFESIRSALINANQRHSRRDYPIPTNADEVVTNNDLSLSIHILPEANVEGMLEDLVFNVLSEDVVTNCVDNFFHCLQDQLIEFRDNVLPKAKIRVFMAGKAVDKSGEGDDKKYWELAHITHTSWWKDEYWEHQAFNKIKAFLRQLAE